MNSPYPHLIRGLHNLQASPSGCVATIGTFDGVHQGHQALLKQVVAKANTLNLPATAIIFEPQPVEYFAPEKAPARLMLLREKLAALKGCGIEQVLCLAFNKQLASLTAQQFIDRVLLQGLNVQHLVVGDDFRFGCDRAGNFDLLKQQSFTVADTATCEADGKRISSTLIRELLAATLIDKESADKGSIEQANDLLGQQLTFSGHVKAGQQLGRTIGVPTANVALKHVKVPVNGVFAVKVHTPQGEYNGVANIGTRPTVDGDNKALLEVHIFDFAADIYGQRIAVQLLTKLRGEKKFASVDALKQQIFADITAAKEFLVSEKSEYSLND